MRDTKRAIAIIGAGHWAQRIASGLPSNIEVKWCVHTGTGVNKAQMEQILPSSTFTVNYQEVLEDTSIDTVMIATPIHTHAKLAKQALQANKHVFVEKPLSTSTDEVLGLQKLSEEKGLILFIGYIFLYNPIFKKIKELLAGQHIRQVKFTWDKYGSFNENIYWNLLIHDLILAVDLLGAPSNLRVTKREGAMSDIDILQVVGDFNSIPVSFNLNRASTKKGKGVCFKTNKSTLIWKDSSLIDTSSNKTLYEIDPTTPLRHEIALFFSLLESTQKIDDDKTRVVTKLIENLIASS